jgi:heme/copper-type cytochrome/quinol oxidase subunit 3
MAAATAPSPLANPVPAPPRRPRVLLFGSAMGAAASALAILSLLAIYLQVRADEIAAGNTALPKDVVLPLTPGQMNLVTLGMSVVTMAWVVYAMRNDDRTHAYVGLGLTLLLGIASIVETAYLYQQLALSPTSGPVAGLIYAITGAHILMTVVGMLFIAVMGFQALGGQLTGRDAEGMSAAALYWYATYAVYLAIWYAIYITK